MAIRLKLWEARDSHRRNHLVGCIHLIESDNGSVYKKDGAVGANARNVWIDTDAGAICWTR